MAKSIMLYIVTPYKQHVTVCVVVKSGDYILSF